MVDDGAAQVAGAGAEFDDVVGRLDDVGVVLDDIDRVAHIDHLLEQVDEVANVLQVEAVGGLVNDKHAALTA